MSSHHPIPLIIDTDPGVDDAIAILFALAHHQFDIRGLTTIYGNVHTTLAVDNALRLLELVNRTDIPVAVGADRPLQGTLDGVAHHVHGRDGFGNVYMPRPTQKSIAQPAAEWMVDKINENPNELHIVALGPLTNLAHALTLDASIAHKVKGIWVMGGAFKTPGNVTPVSEANIHNDPLAADRVFTAGWPVSIFGLDVTLQLQMMASDLTELKARYPHVGGFLHDISGVYQSFAEQVHGTRCVFAHDLAPFVHLIKPELFSMQSGPVRVATEGVAKGLTIQDNRKRWDFPNAWSHQPDLDVAYQVDAQAVWSLYHDTIGRLEAAAKSAF